MGEINKQAIRPLDEAQDLVIIFKTKEAKIASLDIDYFPRMRVIAGKAKGHRLKVPTGTYVRPATDLVRGAIFSILETTADDWSLVLDLFAGSGALGIEALSRGAGWVDFVDHEQRCCDIIRQNLEKTGLTAQTHIYCCSVAKAITFLDKEYRKEIALATLQQ